MGTSSHHSARLRRRQDPPSSLGWRRFAEAGARWQRRGAAPCGAALAFHAAGAIGCALLAVLAVLALVLGPGAGPAVAAVIGGKAAAALAGLLAGASHPPHAALAAAGAVLGLMACSAGAFIQLRRALNAMRDGPALPAMAATATGVLAGLALLLAAGGLLLVSLALGLTLFLFAAAHGAGPGLPYLLVGLADACLSAMLLLPALAALLRWLPDTPPAASAAWQGAALAGVPIVLGKVLLEAWIAGAGPVSVYGAAGAALLTMLWLYGAAQLLLFGAALAASADAADDRRARQLGARPLRAPPERVAANTPMPATPPTSLAAARSRLRPAAAVRRPAEDRRRGSAVLLQFPAAPRRAVPPSS